MRFTRIAAGISLVGCLFAGTDVAALEPTPVAIAAGGNHSCALTTAGEVLCWGAKAVGETLGYAGPDTSSMQPVAGLPVMSAIAAGRENSCAIAADGSVWCWGRGLSGGVEPAPVPDLADVQVLAAGQWHTCALTAAGAVWCWGENGSGQLGNDAGDHHTCAVMESGNVVCWGTSWRGESGDAGYTGTFASISGLSGRAVSIATGFLHTCATTDAGELFCWGANDRGQLGDGRQYTTVEPVAVLPEPSTPTALLAGIALLSSRALRRRGAR